MAVEVLDPLYSDGRSPLAFIDWNAPNSTAPPNLNGPEQIAVVIR